MTDLNPTDVEQQEHILTLRNGVELGLGHEDPLKNIAAKLAKKFPHHLILVQAGSFLHAYSRSAYYLHKLRGYKLRIVGQETAPEIRCGLPVRGHKKSLWNACADYRVPFVVALGQKGDFKLHISRADVDSSLMDQIPEGMVQNLVEDLCQTDRLRTARAAQILLNPTQTTFRLKQVTAELYQKLHETIHRFPMDQRYFRGKDTAECMYRLMRLVHDYATSEQRSLVLRKISSESDLLKSLFQSLHNKEPRGGQKVQLINSRQFGEWSALAVELGNLVGGLLRKQTQPIKG